MAERKHVQTRPMPSQHIHQIGAVESFQILIDILKTMDRLDIQEQR